MPTTCTLCDVTWAARRSAAGRRRAELHLRIGGGAGRPADVTGERHAWLGSILRFEIVSAPAGLPPTPPPATPVPAAPTVPPVALPAVPVADAPPRPLPAAPLVLLPAAPMVLLPAVPPLVLLPAAPLLMEPPAAHSRRCPSRCCLRRPSRGCRRRRWFRRSGWRRCRPRRCRYPRRSWHSPRRPPAGWPRRARERARETGPSCLTAVYSNAVLQSRRGTRRGADSTGGGGLDGRSDGPPRRRGHRNAEVAPAYAWARACSIAAQRLAAP